MQLIPLNCNNCGSRLKVGEDTKFVTCKHCDAQLAVRHEDGAAFTDVMEAAARVEKSAAAIEQHVEKLGAGNERLFLQGEIERVDREWEARRMPWMKRSEDGSLSPPSAHANLILLLAPLMFAPFLLLLSSDIPMPAVYWLFPIAMSGLTVLGSLKLRAQAEAYARALAAHESERTDLVAKLRRHGASADGPPPRRKKRQKRLTNEDDEG